MMLRKALSSVAVIGSAFLALLCMSAAEPCVYVTGGGDVTSNWIYRAELVPYDWAPQGTSRSERAVTPPEPASFHVPSRAVSNESATH